MGAYRIVGGNRLEGTIDIEGAKNAVLPILASTILNKGESILKNVPMLRDTKIALEILEHLGCTYSIEGTTVIVNSKNINNFNMPIELVKQMRSSIIFMGALLSAIGECKISLPGGCKLGKRPIDLHLDNLKKLNVEILQKDDIIYAKTNGVVGNRINLTFPSVGATQNLILASVFCDSETIILNPAKEPEIIDLQNYLNEAGAKVVGAGTDKIVIKGVKKLNDVVYNIMPDRIVAGTYLVAGVMTAGEILLNNINYNDMKNITEIIEKTGAKIKVYDNNKILVQGNEKIKSINKIETNPHPKTPTDMQSQFMAMLSIARGRSRIKENLFENRNKQIIELVKMGADIYQIDSTTSVINGVSGLQGKTVYAQDLRGGASLILAGLVASGETKVENSEHIQRGYVKIEEKLSNIGANIKYIN